MKLVFIIIFVFAHGFASRAQTAEDSVKAAVNLLFAGMKNSDPAAIKSAFADSAILQSISAKEGKTVISNESVNDFSTSISKIARGDADERIQFETIKIDGPLALVWAPYKFFYKGQFSHCGVDSFQLVKIKGVWKIQYLVDTRRKQPCD
jgi:hypothetical protein